MPRGPLQGSGLALEQAAVVQGREVIVHVGAQIVIRGEQRMQIEEIENADFMNAREGEPGRAAIAGKRDSPRIGRAVAGHVEENGGVELLGLEVDDAHRTGDHPAAAELRGRQERPALDVEHVCPAAIGRTNDALNVGRAGIQLEVIDLLHVVEIDEADGGGMRWVPRVAIRKAIGHDGQVLVGSDRDKHRFADERHLGAGFSGLLVHHREFVQSPIGD